MNQPFLIEAHGALVPLKVPESLVELGIRRAHVQDLALKMIYVRGLSSTREMAAAMRLGNKLASEIFRQLRSELLIEVTGMSENNPQFVLTSRGRSLALELLAASQYVGSVPVPLESYVQQVRRQSVRDVQVHPQDIRRTFDDLVLEEATLNKLGTALNSGSSIFLYGPAGAGKTVIATTLPRALANDCVWIPYAVQIEGEIVSVFDAHVHKEVADVTVEDSDPRWVLCHRPTVLVGGELSLDMLDLQMNPISKFYTAPVQMKANNGVLIIDDFGRQRMTPQELLNRWVVPLDRRIDFVTLAGGRHVEIPFELLVVFATNLDPSTLADPAFLRRIQTKIRIDSPSVEEFKRIFSRVCSTVGIPYEESVVDELIHEIQDKRQERLRACHPRDIVNQVRWAARYENRPPKLDRSSMLTAVASYFVP
jgi:predicted ATPase with chaperone activity